MTGCLASKGGILIVNTNPEYSKLLHHTKKPQIIKIYYSRPHANSEGAKLRIPHRGHELRHAVSAVRTPPGDKLDGRRETERLVPLSQGLFDDVQSLMHMQPVQIDLVDRVPATEQPPVVGFRLNRCVCKIRNSFRIIRPVLKALMMI